MMFPVRWWIFLFLRDSGSIWLSMDSSFSPLSWAVFVIFVFFFYIGSYLFFGGASRLRSPLGRFIDGGYSDRTVDLAMRHCVLGCCLIVFRDCDCELDLKRDSRSSLSLLLRLLLSGYPMLHGRKKKLSDEDLDKIEKTLWEHGLEGRMLSYQASLRNWGLRLRSVTAIRRALHQQDWRRCIACQRSFASKELAERRVEEARKSLAAPTGR
ncbi:hypothetical protein B0H63DRAFT_282101 [Podospora didyma]|uniref:Uncharacterized protein n=1 Tax=Podospora didyma TaxID=330526 RepID=A0AAE0K921_9PEZI|nr:hypothetical protein B0H63DRAFT_282101 [Podospora didyma]